MAGNYDVAITVKALDQFSSTFQKLQKQIGNVKSWIDKSELSLSKFHNSFKMVGRKLSTHLTAPIIGMGTYMLKQINDFGEIRKRLILITGSAEKADIAFNKLKEIYKTSEAPMESLSNTLGVLIGNFGVPIERASKIVQTFADVAEGAKVGYEELSSTLMRMYIVSSRTGGLVDRKAALHLLQIVPRLGQEVRNLGGKSKAAGDIIFNKFVQGKLKVDEFNKALSAVGRNKAPDTIEEAITKIHHIFRIMVDDIGSSAMGIFDVNKKGENLVVTFSKLETKLSNFVQLHPQIVKVAVALTAVLAVLGPIAILTSLIFSKATLISLAIIALGAGLLYVWTHCKFIRDAMHEIWNWAAGIVDKIKALIGFIGDVASATGKWVKSLPGKISSYETVKTTGLTPAYSLAGLGVEATMKKYNAMNQVNIGVNITDKVGVAKTVDVQHGNGKKTPLNTGRTNHSSRVVGR